MRHEERKEKPKNRKMMKIGQLVGRQLNVKDADEMARNAEDHEVVMTNAYNDRMKEVKKRNNRANKEEE